MNPPFGTRTKGIDMVFVKAAIDVRTPHTVDVPVLVTDSYVACSLLMSVALLCCIIACCQIATTSVYSLHKSSTRKVCTYNSLPCITNVLATWLTRAALHSLHDQHILKQAQKWGVEAKVLAEVQFDIPAMYKFHRKKHVDVAVDFIRFGIPAGRNDRAKAAKAEASDAADADDGAAATAPAPATATATTAAETTEPATAAAATGGAGAGGGAGAADSEDVGATLSDDLTNKAVIQA